MSTTVKKLSTYSVPHFRFRVVTNMASTPPFPPSGTSTPNSFSTYLPSNLGQSVSGLLRRLTDPDPTPGFPRTRSPSSTRRARTPNPPVHRRPSPFQPPPLTPLILSELSQANAQLLSVSLAEEIRLLIPPRLQLVEHWELRYSLERDGVSLATLYQKCDEDSGKRGGWVLVVRDGHGSVCLPSESSKDFLADPRNRSSAPT
jgi:hypothetical protein